MKYDLDKFTRSYCVAMLWSSTDDNGEPLDSLKDIEDIAPDTMKAIISDCKKFQEENADLILQASDLGDYAANTQYDYEELAGHDFWLNRVGHGAGFWDRNLEEVGDKLNKAAKQYSEFIHPYIGDDGLVYID